MNFFFLSQLLGQGGGWGEREKKEKKEKKEEKKRL